jgi:uncharacterized protein (DUF2336 family)
LLLVDADRLSDQQIDVFDEVFGHLIRRIEGKALAELSQRLAPVKNAPTDVVRQLAKHDDIAVAEPVLTRSARLSDADLIEIARTKPQAHLLAISGRVQIRASVTDALLNRGDNAVMRRLAENTGAHFSDNGYAALVEHSEHDDQLAEKVGLRLDLPLQLLRQLLLRATEAVRTRLLALAGPESREKIQQMLEDASEQVGFEVSIQSERDYAEVQNRLLAMHREGGLTEATIFEFAKSNKRAEVVAALSLLGSAPAALVEKLLQSNRCETLFILCKSAGLDWPTVRAIANCRFIGSRISDGELIRARADYWALARNTAQRAFRFWQVRQTTAANVLAGSPGHLSTAQG